jgi:hypothetical protein
MARYIDADELLNKLPDDLPYKASVKRVLIQAPTADVVPKSEVEKIVEEIDKIFNDYKLSERGLRLIQHREQSIDQRYAELKKKYTENENG